jgi:hypothetical protein
MQFAFRLMQITRPAAVGSTTLVIDSVCDGFLSASGQLLFDVHPPGVTSPPRKF